MLLEPTDRCRQRLLGEVQTLGRLREIELLGDGQEVAHLAQLDAIQVRQRVVVVKHGLIVAGDPAIHN